MALVESVAAIATSATSILLYMLVPPLLDGIERKIRAKIQTRYGPPTVLQTWYDILKLISKELRVPSTLQYGALLLALTFSLTVTTLYMLTYLIMSFTIHTLTLITVLIISIHTLLAFISTVSSNPFSIIGIFRGMAIDIVNEMGFIVAVPIYYLSIKTFNLSLKSFPPLLLSLILITAVAYVSGKRLPYDLHEAEPELASGSIIEFSGPILALYIYLHLIDRYVMIALPIAIGIGVGLALPQYISLILTHVMAMPVYILFGVTAAVLGRSRIDIAVKTLIFIYSITITAWIVAKLV